MTASDIIERLGGISEIARHLGWPTSTVGSWVAANHIPEWRHPALLRMAVERNVVLSTADFPARERAA
jgi:hypothetical protein